MPQVIHKWCTVLWNHLLHRSRITHSSNVSLDGLRFVVEAVHVTMQDGRMAQEVFKEMCDKELQPDVHTYNSLMNVFSESPFEVCCSTSTRQILPGFARNALQ